jgi:hypothetical protein
MKPRHAAALALVGWYLMVPNVGAEDKAPPCRRQSAILAEEEASTLRTWESIYASFVRYRGCDDGAIAEGYSESVIKMLALRWEQFPSLERLIARDGSFQQFVIRHIDDTVDARDLDAAAANALRYCPTQATSLCSMIRQKALNPEGKG